MKTKTITVQNHEVELIIGSLVKQIRTLQKDKSQDPEDIKFIKQAIAESTELVRNIREQTGIKFMNP